MRRFLILMSCLLLGVSMMLAQSLDSVTHIDSEQRLFLRQNQAFYVHFSTQEKGEIHTLKNSYSPKFEHPIHFEETGVYHLNMEGPNGQKADYVIHVDGNPPKLTASMLKANTFSKSETSFYGRDLSIALEAEDDLAGLESIWFRLDQDTFTNYQSPFHVRQEGEHQLTYYASDMVGNLSPKITQNFVVDMTAPKSSHTFQGVEHDNIFSIHASFFVNSEDEGVGVKQIMCGFDGVEMKAFEGELSVKNLSDGEHHLVYYAEDHVGNQEETQTHYFYLDKIPPMASFRLIGDRYQTDKLYVSPRTRISFAAVDNQAGVKHIIYSINGDAEHLYEQPFLLPSGQKQLAIRYYAVDQVENSAKANQENLELYYDDEDPQLQFAFSEPLFETAHVRYISPKTQIEIQAQDQVSGLMSIQYQLDSKASETYTDAISCQVSGKHKLVAIAKDQVNNQRADTCFFFLDSTPPTLQITASVPSTGTKEIAGEVFDIYPPHATFFLAASDAHSGVENVFYRINEHEEQPYLRPISMANAEKSVKIFLSVVDKVGNIAEQKIMLYIAE